MKNNSIISLLTALLLLAMLTISCEEKVDPDTLPDLPPVDALLMDFDDFIDNPSTPKELKSQETYQSALYSYVTVSAWNLLVSVNMVIPVAAYLESFNHTPAYLGDNTWQWTYSVNSGMDVYTARLVTKRISNDEFTAEMYVSKVGGVQDFKWFEGTVRYDRTHAEWTMYESPLNNVAWLSIEWNKDWELETSDITYEIVKTGDPELGSYITLGIVEDTDYDAYYTISYSQKDTYIKWNRTTSAGRVKDEAQFGDTEWHCWDALFQDVDCN